MLGIVFSILTSLCLFCAKAVTFEDLAKKLDDHDLIQAKISEASSLKEEARQEGSWGDPQLTFSAVNFPADSLERDESMMTGLKLGLSQRLSLSGRYGELEEAGKELSKSSLSQMKQLKRLLIKKLWLLVVENERLLQEKVVLEESLSWLKRNLKITKRLYATGKVPQQAVLDIQIRKSELQAQVEQKGFEQRANTHHLNMLFASKEHHHIMISDIPWTHLEKWQRAKDESDFELAALKHKLNAKELKISAQKRNFIPDVTIGVSYTKRNDIDGLGDFVGAQITIPLPTSSKRYAAKNEAVFKRMVAQRKYRHYLSSKPHILKSIELEIKDLKNRLSILSKETLKYAKSSRDITAKSYSRGGADYLELLRSELQYQKQLLKQIHLQSQLKQKKVNYLFVKGDDLISGGRS